MLKDKWLCDATRVEHSVLDYVSAFYERLHRACENARQTLLANQSKMQWQYDKKAKARAFEAGDKVLVLLPIPSSVLQARFSGPHAVERKLSDYVINTPDRGRSSRVCHLNMFKHYVGREAVSGTAAPTVPEPVAAVCGALPRSCPLVEDAFINYNCLRNSEALKGLQSFLAHLSDPARRDVDLINVLICFQITPVVPRS